jgi:DNA-binding transcriptional LysR family regulator
LDRLESMKVFVRVADLGSFTKAAAALELSGPMVGRHVRQLEERLGARLINRTTRRQGLTELGRTYYDRCRTVLAEVEAADAAVTEQLATPRGRLRVAMPVHLGRHCVAPILLALAKEHPLLELDLSFEDRLVDLEDGYDLAIRTGSLADRAGVVARRVATQSMILCASPSYLEEHGAIRSLVDLHRHQGVVYRRGGRVRPWLFPQEGGQPAEITLASQLRMDDLDVIADAAAEGMGVAWLPSWLVRGRLATGSLIRVLPEQPSYPYDCHALWTPAPRLAPKLRAAIDALATKLPALMD